MIEKPLIVFREHAYLRMEKRRISYAQVISVIETGECIEEYPEAYPFPAKLFCKKFDERPIHVVIAENKRENEVIIITVYEADSDRWVEDYRRRRN